MFRPPDACRLLALCACAPEAIELPAGTGRQTASELERGISAKRRASVKGIDTDGWAAEKVSNFLTVDRM